MSNSKLVSYINISPNRNSPRSRKIDTIAIHCMAGNMTVQSCGEMFARSSTQASSNYGIDSKGNIGLYVEEKDRSWCTSDSIDEQAVTIEVANTETCEPYRVSALAYSALLDLVTDICKRNGIRKLKWKADASLKYDTSKQNMVVHRWFASKSCPGNYLYGAHSAIAEEVNNRLNGGKPSSSLPKVDYSNTVSTDNIGDDSSTNFDGSANIEIDHTQFTNYIVTIDRNTKSINYESLKDLGVVGVMIEAGSLYSSSHTIQSYRNPKLPQQVQDASDADVPFALYTDVRSRNAGEAKKEIAQLHRYIMAYPPALGVWLHLYLGKSKKINNEIIEVYRTELTRFGLKGKIGIYATRDQMKLFDWEKYYNDYYLWLDDHVKDINEIDTLLTPEFFMLNSGG